jgi:outer membrane lipoprotein-sorting protein
MLDTDRDLEEAIRRSTQVEVPDEVRQRMQHRLAELREKIQQQPANRRREWSEMFMRPMLFRIAAIAAVALAVVLAWTLLPGGAKQNRVYAAAAAQMRDAQSLEYRIVLAPDSEIGFSYLAPAYRRVSCSWGTEIRNDGSGKELVLMHLTRNYVMEESKNSQGIAESSDLVDGLRSLPKKADQFLGTKEMAGRRLTGYRVLHLPVGAMSPDFKAMDLWVDAGTGEPDHVDISFQPEGKPLYEMHIEDIHVGREMDVAMFAMTPPANYKAINAPNGSPQPNITEKQQILQPRIEQLDAMSLVVVPVDSSYPHAQLAMRKVRSWLSKEGISPSGSPLMQYVAKTEWHAGYPVPSGARAEKPFQRDDIPASSVASVVVRGPWGQDTSTSWGHDPGSRWASFVMWIGRQGYMPVGPPTEIWSGTETQPSSQSTEMRIAVVRKN